MLVHFLKKTVSGTRKQQSDTKEEGHNVRAKNMATVPAVMLALHKTELHTTLIASESTA